MNRPQVPASIVAYRRELWAKACKAQGTDPSSNFVVFDDKNNEAAAEYNNFCLAVVRACDLVQASGESVLIYRCTHKPEGSPREYDAAFTLPMFGERIGDRVEPPQPQYITV